ncbi:MAG TPA: 50S ribosomal protein L24 [Armatimonadetes bacterium]|nr:50S ribosomal protein L24 [Armatimonadota bacterium]
MRKGQNRNRRTKLQVKKGDMVLILRGKDRGRRGRVQEVSAKEGWVRVEGANIVVRHRRPRSRTSAVQQQTGRIEMPGPIQGSNVMLICPHCDQPTRPRRIVVEERGKVRQCRRCNEIIDEPIE